MKQDLSTSELVQTGEMTQAPWNLSPEAYAVWEAKRQQRMRKRLAEKGQPLVYHKDGVAIAEYADGTIKVIA